MSKDLINESRKRLRKRTEELENLLKSCQAGAYDGEEEENGRG